jgi:hypothetical protein
MSATWRRVVDMGRIWWIEKFLWKHGLTMFNPPKKSCFNWL